MARILIRGAAIVSMDERVGDLTGDVLVEDGDIAAVGPGIEVDRAACEIVDAAGCIVIPGLINAHMHTWQTGLRGVAANWTLLEYFKHVHAGLATLFGPSDIGIATLAGALNQINCGTTTLVDWCHNNPTPAHTDAAIDALIDSGIRAAFFHGSPKPDARPGERPFWEVPHPRAEVERLTRARLPGNGGLVTLGLAILGPHYSTLEVALSDFALAREFGLTASMHQGGGEARTPDGWQRLEAAGLLGAHINIVHGNNLSDDQLRRFVDLGMSFSITPENEMAQGHGHPITGRLRALGSGPTLGVDLESVLSGDMFTVARMALAMQRTLDNAEHRARHGSIPETSTIPVREALEWVTMRAARMLGMADRIGSLSPGKAADLVIIDARQLNMRPVIDPVASVVMQTSLANIDAVMIAGQWKKRGGRLLRDDLARVGTLLEDSGRRIVGEMRARMVH
ncbi:MAG: amidohydrolase family protein [Burkholderiales bacterium]|nr:amidohydrolase family protein [Burkholderiales bacterium]